MNLEPVGDVGIDLVVVVIPVRNEAERVAACLSALAEAVRALRHRPPARNPVRVRPLVVLDRCTDGTDEIIGGFPWVETVVSSAGRVGAARAIGVQHALAGETVVPERIWIATTDADSRVPADWLTHQLDLAERGVQLFRGLVEPDPDECGAATFDAWSRAYVQNDGHPHVHGANLGVRADAYLLCGGFAELALDEDVTMSRTAQLRQLRIFASASARVATSGRLRGRVEGGGFADYLENLRQPAGS